jgi:hypothetical protein
MTWLGRRDLTVNQMVLIDVQHAPEQSLSSG